MKLIKLVDSSYKTKNGTTWNEIGKTISINPEKRKPVLCSDGVLHAYESLETALLLHVNYTDFKVLEVEGDVVVSDGLKTGSYDLKILREIDLPNWYLLYKKEICQEFAILCAEEVLHLFTKIFPDDHRPEKAIKAKRKCISSYTNADANADAAANAAANAAYGVTYYAANAANAAKKKINISKLAKLAVENICAIKSNSNIEFK
jgi:hypothetical protein